jgi:hypothetical protein
MNENQLTEHQCKALREIIGSEPGFKVQGIIGEFMDLWLVCEVLVKKLIMYHTGLNELPFSWQYTQIAPALKHFGISYQEDNIKPVFSGDKKAKRGEKSARTLRNGYIHTLSRSDRSEIEERKEELVPLLTYWKSTVENATQHDIQFDL